MTIDRLRLLREARGLTQKQLAQEVRLLTGHAVWPETLSRIETGKNRPAAWMAEALAKILSTSVDYVLGVTDDPAPRGDLAVADSRAVYHARRLPAEVQAVAAQLVDLGEDMRGKLLDAFDLILDVAGAAEAQAAQEGEALAGAAEHLRRLLLRLSPEEVAYWTQQIAQRLSAQQPSESQAETTADLPEATAQTPQ